MLVDHFIKMICNEYGVGQKPIEKSALKALSNVNWTGNIRELRNVVERLIILSGDQIKEKDVRQYVLPASAAEKSPVGGIKAILDKFTNIDELKAYVEKEFVK